MTKLSYQGSLHLTKTHAFEDEGLRREKEVGE
jgi:hypothetical protein